MTQTELIQYSEQFKKLQKKQRENVKVYNRQQTKKSKRKVMKEKIIPLEDKIERLRK